MTNFFESFNNPNATLTLNNQQFKRSDCKLLGEGCFKLVYGINGTPHCFFLPKQSFFLPKQNAANWDETIEAEKMFSDIIISHGLKAQAFEIKSLTIQENAHGRSHKINVMLTKTFDQLAQEHSLTIFDPKASKSDKHLIGEHFSFYKGKQKNLNDPSWNQKIIEPLLKQYAVALSYGFPISEVKEIDDSEHLYFERQNNQEPPKTGYMFWDIAGDMAEDINKLRFPVLPNLATLKSGIALKRLHKKVPTMPFHEMDGIRSVCQKIANVCASKLHEGPTLNFKDNDAFFKKVTQALLSSVDAKTLQSALTYAKTEVEKYIEDTLFKQSSYAKSANDFLLLLRSCISSGNLELVKQALTLKHDKAALNQQQEKLLKFSRKYENKNITQYLKTHFPKLKNSQPQDTAQHAPKKRVKVDKVPPQKHKSTSIKLKSSKLKKTNKVKKSNVAPSLSINDLLFPTFTSIALFSALLYTGVGILPALLYGTAMWLGAAFFEYIKVTVAANYYQQAVSDKDIIPGKSLTKNTSLSKTYYQKGLENNWDAWLAPMTYLPFSHARKSYLVGKEAAKESQLHQKLKYR